MNESASASTILQTQLARFLVVGLSAVTTDFVCYFALLNLTTHAPAKVLSFIAGTMVAYFFNKFWTFTKPGYNNAEIVRFIILYTLTLVTNVVINTLSLFLFPALTLLAFLLATGTSTVLNFIGQKWWVFK